MLAAARLVNGANTAPGTRCTGAREIESVILGPYHGAVPNTETFLAVAHDDGKGEILFEKRSRHRLLAGRRRAAVFQRVDSRARARHRRALGDLHAQPALGRHVAE